MSRLLTVPRRLAVLAPLVAPATQQLISSAPPADFGQPLFHPDARARGQSRPFLEHA